MQTPHKRIYWNSNGWYHTRLRNAYLLWIHELLRVNNYWIWITFKQSCLDQFEIRVEVKNPVTTQAGVFLRLDDKKSATNTFHSKLLLFLYIPKYRRCKNIIYEEKQVKCVLDQKVGEVVYIVVLQCKMLICWHLR